MFLNIKTSVSYVFQAKGTKIDLDAFWRMTPIRDREERAVRNMPGNFSDRDACPTCVKGQKEGGLSRKSLIVRCGSKNIPAVPLQRSGSKIATGRPRLEENSPICPRSAQKVTEAAR